MARLKLSKINFIDTSVVVVVLLIVGIGAAYYMQRPLPSTSKLRVTVQIGSPVVATAVLAQAETDMAVYLNSVDRPLTVQSVSKVYDKAGGLTALDVTLEGPGAVDKNGSYIFNGQRILINQKAEIHGNYFATGAVVKIENAN